ncbi:hypothetical protein N0V90_010366 [Kalmusia sp. IMI 367209]|nr:hypothetical protein N0V90_010366 [Kalmusia sp. IMI 367209]
MERFRRTSSPSGRALVIGGERASGRKSLSLGRAAESFQSKLIASFRSVRRGGSGEELARHGSPFLVAFLRLPNELHVQILCELFIADLLALRRTSRALNDLITACGPALVRFWVKHKMGTLHTRLYPPPRTNEAHLQYLHTLRHTNQRQKQMWASVYEKMIPLVFGVGYFLEEHRRILLERDLGRIRPRSHIGYDICTTPGITSQERDILKKLDRPLRLQFFYMYCFILQVLMRKLRPPTYAGSVEKVFRGWHGKPACVEDIAFVLILGGVGAVAKLLACQNYSERRRLLHAFITRLSPHENVNWRKHWRDLGVTSHALLDDIPCSSIGITQLDQIWTPLIVEGMSAQSMEFTQHDRDRYEEVRVSRNFLNELMGYDILRGRPADADDSDDEGRDEM